MGNIPGRAAQSTLCDDEKTSWLICSVPKAPRTHPQYNWKNSVIRFKQRTRGGQTRVKFKREDKAPKWIQMAEPLAWININIPFTIYTRLAYICCLVLFLSFTSTYCLKKKTTLRQKLRFYFTFCSHIVRQRHEKVWQGWRAFTYTYFRRICSWINNFTIHFWFTKNSLSTW